MSLAFDGVVHLRRVRLNPRPEVLLGTVPLVGRLLVYQVHRLHEAEHQHREQEEGSDAEGEDAQNHR